MIKVGILGAGEHSTSQHGLALRHLKQANPSRLDLAAVCDLDLAKAREYARKFGFTNVYTRLDDMLHRERLDALVLITPEKFTFDVVSGLLPSRLPLLIEKPPGLRPEQTLQLLTLAREHACPHIVSFNRRFNPAVERARQWLADRAQGRPVLQATARMLRVARREPGFIADTGIHLVDTVLSFLPAPTSVASRRWEPAILPTDSAPVIGGQSCEGRIEFADGCSAVTIFAPDCGVQEETYELLGSEYCIQIDTIRHAVKIFDRGSVAIDWSAPADTPPYIGYGTLGETERFLSAIEGSQSYWPTLEEGLLAMRVTHALQSGGRHEIQPPP